MASEHGDRGSGRKCGRGDARGGSRGFPDKERDMRWWGVAVRKLTENMVATRPPGASVEGHARSAAAAQYKQCFDKWCTSNASINCVDTNPIGQSAEEPVSQTNCSGVFRFAL